MSVSIAVIPLSRCCGDNGNQLTGLVIPWRCQWQTIRAKSSIIGSFWRENVWCCLALSAYQFRLRIWGSGVRISSGAPVILLKIKENLRPSILEANSRLLCGPNADPLERKKRCGKMQAGRSNVSHEGFRSEVQCRSAAPIAAHDVNGDRARRSRARPSEIPIGETPYPSLGVCHGRDWESQQARHNPQ